MSKTNDQREGGLSASVREPLAWKDPDFYNEDKLVAELERVFDICHGCRRCFNLCHAFPLLFDAIDDSSTGELESVAKDLYWQLVNHCYLCDICFMTKCPYVPPHEWNIDFPGLMLRAKAIQFKKKGAGFRDKFMSDPDRLAKLNSIPLVAPITNASLKIKPIRSLLAKLIKIHRDAPLPEFYRSTMRKRINKKANTALTPEPGGITSGKVLLYSSCYFNYNMPQLGEDFLSVFEHNDMLISLTEKDKCCGMPKLELGDLESVAAAMNINIPMLSQKVDEGWDIVVPMPSCAFMIKQLWPLLDPDNEQVKKVSQASYDPFEYLMARHKDAKLNTDFKQPLGKIAYHVPCHLRVQNIGLKTRDFLNLIPESKVIPVERCSAHDGSYTIKNEFHETSMKLCRPTADRIKKAKGDHFVSDCPMAARQIKNSMDSSDKNKPTHPLTLARIAYGL